MLSKLRQRFLATAASTVLMVAGSLATGTIAMAETLDTGTPLNANCKPDYTKGTLTSGALNWGLKQSFLKYIKGQIANGKWELSNGTSYIDSNKQFQFPLQTGTYNADTKAFNVKFTGKIDFEGHKYGDGTAKLKLIVENPELVGDSDGAKLYANVTSRSLENEKDVEYGRVELGKVTLDEFQTNGGILTINSLENSDEEKGTVGVALTADGVSAFANFYKEGVGLDLLKMTAQVTYPTTCSDSQSTDAHESTAVDSHSDEDTADSNAPFFDSNGCPAPRVEHKLEDEPLDQTGLKWSFTNVILDYAQQEGFKMYIDQGFPTSDSITFDRLADISVSGDSIIASWPGQVRFVKDGKVGIIIGKPRVVMKPGNLGEIFMTISSPENDEQEFKVGTFHGATYIDDSLGFYGALRLDNAPVELNPEAVGVMPGIKPDTKLPPITIRLDLYERSTRVVKNGAAFFQSVWENSKQCAKLAWLNHYSAYEAPPVPTGEVEIQQPYQISVEEENKSWNEESPGQAVNGTLRWGIKKSWRSYTAGSVVSQSPQVTFDENTYVFTEGKRLSDLEDGTQVIQYQGRLHYVKYGGILNIVFTEPQIRIAPDGSAVLWMKRDFALPNGTPVDNSSERAYFFPAVTLGKPAKKVDGVYQVVDAPTYLTSQMADIFIYAYRAGLRMSDISFTAPEVEKTAIEEEDTTQENQAEEENVSTEENPTISEVDIKGDTTGEGLNGEKTEQLTLEVLNGEQIVNKVNSGSKITIRTKGFADGEVFFTLHSNPIRLGSAYSKNGLAMLTANIPNDVEPGKHKVVAKQGEKEVSYELHVLSTVTFVPSEKVSESTDEKVIQSDNAGHEILENISKVESVDKNKINNALSQPIVVKSMDSGKKDTNVGDQTINNGGSLDKDSTSVLAASGASIFGIDVTVIMIIALLFVGIGALIMYQKQAKIA